MGRCIVKRAIYSGTFDPFTNGHLDILQKALEIFDNIVIAVATSKSKKPMFDIDTRVGLIKKATSKFSHKIDIIPFDILLVDFAKQQNINNIIRGVRTNIDFEYEMQMAYANNSLDKNIQTIFLTPSLQNSFVSSTIVRELIKFGGNFSHLVPKETIKDLILYNN